MNARAANRLSFALFQATGQDVADLSKHIDDLSLEGRAGRLYADCVYMEPNTGPNAQPSQPWCVEVGNWCHTGALEECERELYAFYASECADDDVRPYLLDTARGTRYLPTEADTEESLCELLPAYAAFHGLESISADEMLHVQLTAPDRASVQPHIDWLTRFIERWDAVMDPPATPPPPGATTPITRKLAPISARLTEALDNATASLETCMAHYAARMPPADVIAREHVIAEARALIAEARAQPTPRALIHMDGGLCHAVLSEVPLDVLIVDYDDEGADPEEITAIPQDDGSTEDALARIEDADTCDCALSFIANAFAARHERIAELDAEARAPRDATPQEERAQLGIG